METQVILKIVMVAFSFGLGIISFFLKRLMSNHDKNSEKIIDIEKNYVKKEELERREKELKAELRTLVKDSIGDVKEDIKNMKEEFGESNNKTLKAVDSLAKQVSNIQLNYISKDDFLTQNINLASKIDKLYEMMYEERTKNKS